MPFEYNYTCPAIDSAINRAKGEIEAHLDSIVEELNPMFAAQTSAKDEWVKDATERLYADIEDSFESVRNENADMRKEADSQFEELESELDDLKIELKEAYEAQSG